MITLRTLKEAITTLLKTKYPNMKVHFDNAQKSNAPYFYVEMQPLADTIDDIYTARTIQIDITAVLSEDKYGNIKRVELYDIADILDAMIRPVLRVDDRAITVLHAEETIHDDVLHYIFNLDFTDAFEHEATYELMNELILNLRSE